MDFGSCVSAPGACGRAAGARVARGMTLIELAVTMVVVALLIAVALPSFTSLIQNNRVMGEVNSFVSDLQFARSEAIKQGLPVSLCPSSNGTSCLGTNSWSSGWIVFPDATGSGSIASGVTPLRARQALVGGDSFAATPSTTAFTFSRDGFAINLAASGVTLVLHTSPVNAAATRCVALTLVGHETVQSAGTGSCT
ncbi:MAG: GspH/FimT family pseudopilin [Burkholderiales bacterium]|nr:GspH/FimT family pseudopilin [Burkholderiales bacterium]